MSNPQKKRAHFSFLSQIPKENISEIDQKQYSSGSLELKSGTKTTGVVTGVKGDYIIVDIGAKSEGKINIDEFKSSTIESLPVSLDSLESVETTVNKGIPQVGDEIEVFIVKLEGRGGRPILSKTEALKKEAYDELEKIYESGRTISGEIVSPTKAGYVVRLKNCVETFLPGGQLDLGSVPKNPNDYIGKTFDFKILRITNIDKLRKNIIVSRRVILEEFSKLDKAKAIKHLVVGSKVKGVIKNILWYGVFVRIAVDLKDEESEETKTYHLDGLVHVTDISWDRVHHPSEKLSVGDEYELIIKDIDTESLRIHLSIKANQPNPWDQIEQQYAVGSKIIGKITSIAPNDTCAFLSLGGPIEGILPSNEIVWSKPVSPKKYYFIGQDVEVIISEIDKANQKIIVSVKQLTPNPWTSFAEQHAAGDKLSLRIESIKEYGTFLSLTDKNNQPLNIEGLVHVHDFSWSKDGAEQLSRFSRGDVVECIILNIDADKQKVSLGVKQLTDDPYKEAYAKYQLNEVISVMILGRRDDYLMAKTQDEISVIIPRSEIASVSSERRFDRFGRNDMVKCVVLAVERQENRIIASIAEYEKNIMQTENRSNNFGDLINSSAPDQA